VGGKSGGKVGETVGRVKGLGWAMCEWQESLGEVFDWFEEESWMCEIESSCCWVTMIRRYDDK
jgi:hypothetical protein